MYIYKLKFLRFFDGLRTPNSVWEVLEQADQSWVFNCSFGYKISYLYQYIMLLKTIFGGNDNHWSQL